MKKSIIIFAVLLGLSANAQVQTVKDDDVSKTDEVLAKVVEKALIVAEKTGEFVVEQAPDVLQQFFAWHIASNIYWLLFALLMFLGGRYFPYLWLSKDGDGDSFFNRNAESSYSDAAMGAWVFFSAMSVLSAIVFFIHVYDLAYILIAPKLYLIDYFVNLK